jgi:hypothetical protein
MKQYPAVKMHRRPQKEKKNVGQMDVSGEISDAGFFYAQHKLGNESCY